MPSNASLGAMADVDALQTPAHAARVEGIAQGPDDWWRARDAAPPAHARTASPERASPQQRRRVVSDESSDGHADRHADESSECHASPEPRAPRHELNSDVPSVLRKIRKWGDYASFGAPILIREGCGFVPMKTPLPIQHQNRLADDVGCAIANPHSLKAFVAAQLFEGRTIRAVVDLTCHDCLYADDIDEIEYHHLATPAQQFVDPRLVAKLHVSATRIWDSSPGDGWVAVHCSYGFNRTGFVLCSYLAEFAGLPIDRAISEFQAARAPGIKHGSFTDELIRRYGGEADAPYPNRERISSETPSEEGAFHATAADMDNSRYSNDSLRDRSAGDAAA